MSLYSFEYTKLFEYDDRDNVEYWINYNGHDEGVDNFLKREPRHKVVINLVNENDLTDFLISDKIKFYIGKSSSDYCPFVFCLKYNKYGIEISKLMKKNNIPFFFNRHANSWDEIMGLLSTGVSEIYVCEELCFDLPTIADIAHMVDVKIRVIPNICQSKWENTPSLKQFFIRPEDMPIYEQYVDVFEFWGDKRTYNVLYETYALKRKWFGPLKEIILGFEGETDNKCIIPTFGEVRSRCGKRCNKGKNCHICEKIDKLASALAERELYVKSDN